MAGGQITQKLDAAMHAQLNRHEIQEILESIPAGLKMYYCTLKNPTDIMIIYSKCIESFDQLS